MNNRKTPMTHTLITLKFALAAAVAAVLASQSSYAVGTMTYDLRASAATGGIVNNTKSVSADVGTVITLDLWARVTGTDGIANETLRSGYGMLLANSVTNLPVLPSNVAIDSGISGNNAIYGTGTTLKGNFAISGVAKGNMVAPYNAGATVNNGVVRDLNNDGSLDIGGTSSAASTGFVLFDATLANGAGTEGPDFHQLSVDSREWRVASYQFTITSAPNGSGTGVNWAVPSQSSLAAAARWSFGSDAATRTGSANAGLSIAAPVVILAVPEPSAFGMVALGALGLVGFRRLGLRRAT